MNILRIKSFNSNQDVHTDIPSNTTLGKILQHTEQLLPGQRATLAQAITTLVAGGHVLLEGVPGVGKTLMAQVLSRLIDGEFKRIQMTSDLLPSEIIGGLRPTYNQQGQKFAFVKGPLFSNVVLIDELNRASPRTQSALLEAMAENQVSVDGQSYNLPDPFLVVATQNPLESSGTFPLPESQWDRFMMFIPVSYPDRTAEMNLYRGKQPPRTPSTHTPVIQAEQPINLTQLKEKARLVHTHESIVSYVYEFIDRTRRHEQISTGVSVRGALHLLNAARAYASLQDRDYLTGQDIRQLAVRVCAHRISLKDSQLPYLKKIQIIDEIMASVPMPQ
jgi:MoxR-like ATPase